MKISNFYKKIFYVFFVVLLASSSFYSQGKRNRNTKKSKTTKKLTLPDEQRESLLSFLDTIQEIDTTYTTNSSEFADKAISRFERITINLPPDLSNPASSVIDAYRDWGFLYGYITKTGAYGNSLRLGEAEGNPSDIIPSIVKKYGLAGLPSYQALQALENNKTAKLHKFLDALSRYYNVYK